MEDLTILRSSLEHLEKKLLSVAADSRLQDAALHPDQREAALNLLQYLCLRSEDLRELQVGLHDVGLSSLASSESHILRQVEAILMLLGKDYRREELSSCTYASSRAAILQRAALLFGQKADTTIPYLMVTFDTDFAGDDEWIKELLHHGMNVARINCAHDDEEVRGRMVGSIHRAVDATGLPCKVYMDLAGPKIRTIIRGKGRKEGKVMLTEGAIVTLAEAGVTIAKKEIVIGCTLDGIVRHLEKDHRVLFDDGSIEAVVVRNGEEKAELRITRISAQKHALKPGKGINFPDSVFGVPALTDYDRECLPFVRKHADLVGFSFVEDEAGLADLQTLLKDGGSGVPYIILKIERPAAVQNLPGLLLQGMRQEAFGIMIARGDLAVEIGFERLSEIQEEVVWLSEAAHVPVIWARQVLETLNKTGLATRSEVTDAAYAAQSECVMINKGEHLLKVMDTLKNILRRSGGHHVKKRYTFRPLSIARNFMSRIPGAAYPGE